jgi:hypothetical protein
VDTPRAGGTEHGCCASLSPGSGSSSGGAGGLGGRRELPALGSGFDGIFGGGHAGLVSEIRIQDDLLGCCMFHFFFIHWDF